MKARNDGQEAGIARVPKDLRDYRSEDPRRASASLSRHVCQKSLLLNGVELYARVHSSWSKRVDQDCRASHYAPWVKARQKQLEDDVRKTWGSLDLAPERASARRCRLALQPACGTLITL